MKILYYSSHPNLGLNAQTGYGTHMREMIAAFRQLGHKVKPLIMGGEEVDIRTDKPEKTSLKARIKTMVPPYIWGSMRDFQLLRFDKYARFHLEKVCQSFQPDLIYERAAYMQDSGIITAKKLGIPHILEQNAPLLEEQKAFLSASIFSQRAKKVEEQLLRNTNKVCIVSSILRDHFSEKYFLPVSQFMVTPNAINLSRVKRDPSTISQLRQQWKLEGYRVIGFVGSIFPWHGVDLLITAFHHIVDDFSDVKVLIVGDGATLPALKHLTDSLGLSEKIIFAGSFPHEEIFNCIDLMDIAVMAKSNWYGSPVKIFEYGAMKKTIVAPDTAPVKEVMNHGEDGYIVKPESRIIASAFKDLLSNPKFGQTLAENFYKKVVNTYTWDKIASKVLKNFDEKV